MNKDRIKFISVKGIIIGIQLAFIMAGWYRLFSWVLVVPLLLVLGIALLDLSQNKHAVRRNFPESHKSR